MKTIIYFACLLFMSLGVYAQESNLQGLAEESKQISTKISQELNFDDDKNMLLQRAIYTKSLSLYRAEEQMADKPQKLEATKEKIDRSFQKILVRNFTQFEIESIDRFMKSNE